MFPDVVDNDSWRIWPGGIQLNSYKQSFRDGDLVNVANKYQLVNYQL